MFKFDFDEKALMREIAKQAQPAVNEIAARMTRELEALRVEFEGRPAGDIKPGIKRVFSKDGGNISDPELSEYAQLISEGAKIRINPASLRL